MSAESQVILLVEDDPDSVAMTQRAFQKAELTVPLRLVGDGDQAVAYLEGTGPYADRTRHPIPVLVLLDLKLPRKSGFEVLTWLRQRPELRRLPVVVLTSSKEPSDIRAAYELGANSYLVKPVDAAALREVVHTLALSLEGPLRVLVVDDDPDVQLLVMRELRREFPGILAEQVTETDGLARALEHGGFDLVLTDYRLQWTDGLAVLRAVKARWPDCPVIMFTGTGSEETAVEAMKAGLEDYVLKSSRHMARLPGAVRLALGRAQHRRAAQAAESRYRGLFEGVPVGLYSATPTGQLLDANPALVEMLGYPDRDTLLAVNIGDLYLEPEDRLRWQAAIDRDGIVRAFDVRNRRRDGTVIWVRHSARAVPGVDGRTLACEGAVEDITERKHAEEELGRQREALLQREKLAAMGSLLAGVAHELNNPLSVVMGQASLLQETVGAGPTRVRTEKIVRAAERCSRIVKNFLALARQRPPERQPVQLTRVVEDVLEILAYGLRVDGVDVTLDLASDLPPLWADPHQLHQVIVNLVANAHQAMRQVASRRLVLTTRLETRRARVVLEVADTGPGIPVEIQSRIFEPFFTTKPPGQGTGLGLSLCQGIVEGHGGAIQFESAPGRGTLFRIELPVETPTEVPREAPPVEVPPAVRSLAILVVDDEPDIASLLVDLLSADGHRVETAPNGRVALELLADRTFDVVLSDLKMPELDGPGLYRELERHDPALCRRMAFLTGDALGPETAEFLRRSAVSSLDKPFVLDEVRRVVHERSQPTP